MFDVVIRLIEEGDDPFRCEKCLMYVSGWFPEYRQCIGCTLKIVNGGSYEA